MIKKIFLTIAVLAILGSCDRGDFTKAKAQIDKMTAMFENFVASFKEDQVDYFEKNVVADLDPKAVAPIQEAMNAEIARALPILKQFKLDLEASFNEMKTLNQDIQFYMENPPEELKASVKKYKEILGLSVQKKNGSPSTRNENFTKTFSFFSRLPYKQEKLLETDNLAWGFKLSPDYEAFIKELKGITTLAVDLQKAPK